MIETSRLILRLPGDRDRDALAAVNGDRRVGDWLAGTLDRAHSDALIDRDLAHFAQHGYGLWAVELRNGGDVIGLTGLAVLEPDMPPAPGVEIGWRLSPAAWGQGYASEAARAALAWGFANLDLKEIVAFTAQTNLRSQAVMRRIGMTADPARDFNHPRLASDHPLRRHVTWSIKRP